MTTERRKRVYNIAPATLQARSSKRKETTAAMHQDLDEFWKKCDQFVDQFAAKYKLKRTVAHRRVMRLSRYGKQNKVSSWNAFMFFKSLELNKGTSIRSFLTQFFTWF